MLVVFHQTLLFSTLPHVSIVLLNARRTGELMDFDWTNWYNGWFSYVRNVEYGKYHEPIYRTLEKFSQSTGNQDIDIAAFQVEIFIEIFDWSIFQLYFPSLAITVHNQIDDYTTNQFVSELGGAAGIVLGVSLYTIVKSEFFYDDFGLNEFSVIDDLIDTCSVIIARQRKLLIKMLFDLKIFRKR